MHNIVKNLINIENEIKLYLNNLGVNKLPKIIAVSKTFDIKQISPLISYGHINFGENKVQEAIEKWTEIKSQNADIKLHMLGKLQTNKVKYAVKLFDYIHSVDSEKLAQKIAKEQEKIKKNLKIFLQVNIGDENQKSGVSQSKLNELVTCCQKINLDVVGLMCIPPIDEDPFLYFEKMNKLNSSYNFLELSMGMSSDYLIASKNNATYLRIGSKIFGKRN